MFIICKYELTKFINMLNFLNSLNSKNLDILVIYYNININSITKAKLVNILLTYFTNNNILLETIKNIIITRNTNDVYNFLCECPVSKGDYSLKNLFIIFGNNSNPTKRTAYIRELFDNIDNTLKTDEIENYILKFKNDIQFRIKKLNLDQDVKSDIINLYNEFIESKSIILPNILYSWYIKSITIKNAFHYDDLHINYGVDTQTDSKLINIIKWLLFNDNICYTFNKNSFVECKIIISNVEHIIKKNINDITISNNANIVYHGELFIDKIISLFINRKYFNDILVLANNDLTNLHNNYIQICTNVINNNFLYFIENKIQINALQMNSIDNIDKIENNTELDLLLNEINLIDDKINNIKIVDATSQENELKQVKIELSNINKNKIENVNNLINEINIKLANPIFENISSNRSKVYKQFTILSDVVINKNTNLKSNIKQILTNILKIQQDCKNVNIELINKINSNNSSIAIMNQHNITNKLNKIRDMKLNLYSMLNDIPDTNLHELQSNILEIKSKILDLSEILNAIQLTRIDLYKSYHIICNKIIETVYKSKYNNFSNYIKTKIKNKKLLSADCKIILQSTKHIKSDEYYNIVTSINKVNIQLKSIINLLQNNKNEFVHLEKLSNQITNVKNIKKVLNNINCKIIELEQKEIKINLQINNLQIQNTNFKKLLYNNRKYINILNENYAKYMIKLKNDMLFKKSEMLKNELYTLNKNYDLYKFYNNEINKYHQMLNSNNIILPAIDELNKKIEQLTNDIYSINKINIINQNKIEMLKSTKSHLELKKNELQNNTIVNSKIDISKNNMLDNISQLKEYKSIISNIIV